jgi:hypothetical protein
MSLYNETIISFFPNEAACAFIGELWFFKNQVAQMDVLVLCNAGYANRIITSSDESTFLQCLASVMQRYISELRSDSRPTLRYGSAERIESDSDGHNHNVDEHYGYVSESRSDARFTLRYGSVEPIENDFDDPDYFDHDFDDGDNGEPACKMRRTNDDYDDYDDYDDCDSNAEVDNADEHYGYVSQEDEYVSQEDD